VTRPDPDRDLRELFAASRRQEAAQAPPFDRLWQRARAAARSAPARAARRLGYAAAAAGVLAAALLLWRPVFHETEPALEASILAWRAPTDFLLETPGAELLSTVPKLGAETGALFPAALAAGPSENRVD